MCLNDPATLFFFSSDAREQYQQDVINSLAYPPGFSIRFRYRDEYISDDLTSDGGIEGEFGYVIAVTDTKTRNQSHTPIRRVEVENLKQLGDTWVIDLKLGVNLDSVPKDTDSYYDDIDSIIDSWEKQPGNENGDEVLVRRDSDLEQIVDAERASSLCFDTEHWDSQESNWDRIISKLRETSYSDCLFYRLIGISKSGDSSHMKVCYHNSEKETGYKVRSNNSYELTYSLSQSEDTDFNGSSTKFLTDTEGDISINPGEVKTGIRKDARNVYLSVPLSFTPRIHHIINSTNSASEQRSPNISIPLYVRKSRVRFFYSAAIFLGISLSSGILTPLLPIPDIVPFIDLTWIKSSSLANFLSVLGAAVAAYSFQLYTEHV